MSDPVPTAMQRRAFMQSGAGVAAALAFTTSSITHGQEPSAAESPAPALPTRRLGKTGVDVTILNAGTLRIAGFMDRLLRLSFARGVRHYDTARVYGSEPAFKKWFAERPEVRKQIFLATKQPVRSFGEVLKGIDERLDELGTDYIDLLYYHGLGKKQVDWPKSKEMKDEVEAIKKTGKVRFVGFTTHDSTIPQLLENAAIGNFVDVIMLAYAPWMKKDSPLNKALDRCHDKDIGLIAMKLFAGRGALAQVKDRVPALKERGLTPHQGLLHAAWSDERLANVCIAMTNTDQLREAVEAARRFQPLRAAQIDELRDAVLDSNPTMCANCDGSCGHAGGTKAELGQLARLLTYHDDLGARVLAREEYAGLTAEQRDWHDADLEAARKACHSGLDFATLLPRVDRLLG
ncbi:L-glyceraldehyde 3-phosphate reductase [Aquisphaera giovannonii]|uniref:L-glyceraldehyde 3-phosphate reductase n=1 Tax=Aquisphaera giovannonii TaxID=406548 RepID=A0A5B9W9V6_9BACT|nr:aldo/keto reductase [Aquisphaera giovannonii]QEH36875.1 L-glyceraldehyde 3-phosphate reductase [Aquisphaera giovannonii]